LISLNFFRRERLSLIHHSISSVILESWIRIFKNFFDYSIIQFSNIRLYDYSIFDYSIFDYSIIRLFKQPCAPRPHPHQSCAPCPTPTHTPHPRPHPHPPTLHTLALTHTHPHPTPSPTSSTKKKVNFNLGKKIAAMKVFAMASRGCLLISWVYKCFFSHSRIYWVFISQIPSGYEKRKMVPWTWLSAESRQEKWQTLSTQTSSGLVSFSYSYVYNFFHLFSMLLITIDVLCWYCIDYFFKYITQSNFGDNFDTNEYMTMNEASILNCLLWLWFLFPFDGEINFVCRDFYSKIFSYVPIYWINVELHWSKFKREKQS
jgi:hypothetical protein